jgi:hypothetical protein
MRLSAFLAAGSKGRNIEWWEKLTGKEPAQVIDDRRRGAAIINGMVDLNDGVDQQRFLTLSMAGDRIDWILSFNEMGLDPSNSTEEIGPIDSVTNWFSGLAERWFSQADIPDFARLAFGSVLTHPTAVGTSNGEALRAYLPVEVGAAWRDFLFQVNIIKTLPADSGLAVPYLNRLSRWLGFRAGLRRIVMSEKEPVISKVGEESRGLRSEFDISTPVEQDRAIAREALNSLFLEMVSGAKEIMVEGLFNE